MVCVCCVNRVLVLHQHRPPPPWLVLAPTAATTTGSHYKRIHKASRTDSKSSTRSKRVNLVRLTSDTVRSTTRVSGFRATRRYDTRSRATDDRANNDDAAATCPALISDAADTTATTTRVGRPVAVALSRVTATA